MSDPFGIYEATIFDEGLITEYRDIMFDGNILALECLVKKDQGGSRLLVRSIKTLEEFIKTNKPKKEAYKAIKQQEKRGDFDWKKRNKENKGRGTNFDPLVQNVEYKRKIDELKNKEIIHQLEIDVGDRQKILRLKSFLSQRLAPEGFDKFSKVYFTVNDSHKKQIKIDIGGRYLLDSNDLNKIKIL